MYKHCVKHRPAAEVIHPSGIECPICKELHCLRERVRDLERLANVLSRNKEEMEDGK